MSNVIINIVKYPLLLTLFITFMMFIVISVKAWLNIQKREKTKISFKEAMELTELPVITFYNNDQKVNFLLDTGSNDSHITKSALSKLEYKLSGTSKSVTTMGMSEIDNPCCIMAVSNKNHEFESDFIISDLDDAFNIIKKESGVQIHGILGSKFFQKYKYVLDFEELIAYLK